MVSIFGSGVEVRLANMWMRACGNLIAQIRNIPAQISGIESYSIFYLNQIYTGKICTTPDMQIVNM
jgi:hypothetical protein